MRATKIQFGAPMYICCLAVWLAVGCSIHAQETENRPPTYVSLAKLVASPRHSVAGKPPADQSQYLQDFHAEYLQDFYGTIIETIESSEMRRRAHDRVRALHPDLKETDVEIKASQNRGSTIFNVRAFGTDPKYIRIFLDALLDEFIAFRKQVREQQRNKALTTLHEDVVRREKNLREKQEKLRAFEKRETWPLVEAEHQRLIARIMKLRDSRDDLELESEKGNPPSDLVQRIKQTKASLEKLERMIDELASKIATREELAKQYEDSRRVYDQILDLVRRFTVNENMSSEAITIMERALGAIELTKN